MWYNGSMMEATELKESIADAVSEYADKKQQDGVKSLSRMNPEKVGLILYLFCLGVFSKSDGEEAQHLSQDHQSTPSWNTLII